MIRLVLNTSENFLITFGRLSIFIAAFTVSFQLYANPVVYPEAQIPSNDIIRDDMQSKEAKRLGYAHINYSEWREKLGWKSADTDLHHIFIGQAEDLGFLQQERMTFMAFTIFYGEYCSAHLSDRAVVLPFEKTTFWRDGWSEGIEKEKWVVNAEPEFAKLYLQFWEKENSSEYSLADVFSALSGAINGSIQDDLEETNAVFSGLEGLKEHYGCGSPEMALLKDNMIRAFNKQPSVQQTLRVKSTPMLGYEGPRLAYIWEQGYIYTKPGWVPPTPKKLLKNARMHHRVTPNGFNTEIRAASLKVSEYFWSDVPNGYLISMAIHPMDRIASRKVLKPLTYEVKKNIHIVTCTYSEWTEAPTRHREYSIRFWLEDKPVWVSELPSNHWVVKNVSDSRESCPPQLSWEDKNNGLY